MVNNVKLFIKRCRLFPAKHSINVKITNTVTSIFDVSYGGIVIYEKKTAGL